MTTIQVVRFFEQRPFEPFTMVLVDGREFHVRHPEIATLAQAALVVNYIHPTRQVEVIDTAVEGFSKQEVALLTRLLRQIQGNIATQAGLDSLDEGDAESLL